MERTSDIEYEVSDLLNSLKRGILFIVLFFIVSFFISYSLGDEMLDFIIYKAKQVGFSMIYISPMELLIEQLKLSGIISLIITLPLIVIQLSLFYGPIFERKGFIKVLGLCISACLCFLIGACFSYFILMPFIFSSLYEVGINHDVMAQISVERFVALYLNILIALGFVFELPLLSLSLNRVGILSVDRMKKGRKIALIIALIIGSVITPPDVLSQIMVAIPMMVLYEVSIWICKIVGKKTPKTGEEI